MKSRTSKRLSQPALPGLSAGEQVSGTFELLECILQHLDMQSLLLVQRVCRQWQQTISESPYVQQQLYFQPVKSDGTSTERRKNPLLQQHFQQLFEDTSSVDPRAPRLRPIILAKPGMSIADMRNGRKRHMAFTRKEASWKNMLVTQPPIENILYLKEKSREWYRYDPFIGDFPQGLRMGQLYDLIFSAVWKDPCDGLTGALIRWPSPEGDWVGRKKSTGDVVDLGLAVKDIYREYSAHPDRGCRGHHHGHCRCWDMRTRYLRTRRTAGTRWMFQCEGYVEGQCAAEFDEPMPEGAFDPAYGNMLYY